MRSDLRIMFKKMSSLQWCCMDALLHDYEFYMQICALTMYITISRLCVALQLCFMHVLQNLFVIFKSD